MIGHNCTRNKMTEEMATKIREDKIARDIKGLLFAMQRHLDKGDVMVARSYIIEKLEKALGRYPLSFDMEIKRKLGEI